MISSIGREIGRLLAAPIIFAGLLFIVGLIVAPLGTLGAVLAAFGLWAFGKNAKLPNLPLYFYLSGIPAYLWVIMIYSTISASQTGDQFWVIVMACVWPFLAILEISGTMTEEPGLLSFMVIWTFMFGVSIVFSTLHKRLVGNSQNAKSSSSGQFGR